MKIIFDKKQLHKHTIYTNRPFFRKGVISRFGIRPCALFPGHSTSTVITSMLRNVPTYSACQNSPGSTASDRREGNSEKERKKKKGRKKKQQKETANAGQRVKRAGR
ncbi:uncharacterized protein LOC143153731 [Ptiloglossa arizonensis]|uniref:uncharacterized protein LOC143153731 n=1 Tax=Ptiloglossa arizonensis TaxID=3350558 RepID=UPI003F9F6C28